MTNSDRTYNLRIQLDTKNCDCSAAQIARMERALDALHRVTESFPVSDLYVTIIYHERGNDYHVKLSLVLPGRTLFTGERHTDSYAAYEQCVDKLIRKVAAYKRSLGRVGETSKLQKGTYQEIVPTQLPDRSAVQHSIDEQDYGAFRESTEMYEESVRMRIGRWVQRYPEVQSLIGDKLTLDDLVEDVFLTAFENFDTRRADVSPGDWLESLIDDVIRDVMNDPETELENVNMARVARGA